LLFEWATEYVDLATHKWLARVAVGERPPPTVTRVIMYRQYLGLPILLQEVAPEARAVGPFQFGPGRVITTAPQSHVKSSKKPNGT
jgi:hypothetical protein